MVLASIDGQSEEHIGETWPSKAGLRTRYAGRQYVPRHAVGEGGQVSCCAGVHSAAVDALDAVSQIINEAVVTARASGQMSLSYGDNI
jgi:hypothetical protein